MINSAEALLSEQALSTITARALAKAAGLSEGVLYNYFEDKAEVVLAALVRRFAALVERFDRALPKPGEQDIRANLESVALLLLRLNTEATPLFSKLVSDAPLLKRFIAGIHARDLPFGGKQIRDGLVAYLRAEQRLGRLADVDAGAAADLLLSASAGLAVVGVVAPFAPEARVEALVETLLRGLEPTRRKER